MLPGHVAWPLFLAAGLLALWAADAVLAWLLWAGIALAVGLALATYAALVVTEALQAGPSIVRALVVAALVVLTARVFGDGTWTGVLKRPRGTGFARADDRYWTPAVGLLAVGALAALAMESAALA